MLWTGLLSSPGMGTIRTLSAEPVAPLDPPLGVGSISEVEVTGLHYQILLKLSFRQSLTYLSQFRNPNYHHNFLQWDSYSRYPVPKR